MKGLNRVEFVGHLGQAPVITKFENGGKKAEFSLATSDGYKDNDGNWQDSTDWHNCFATGKLAEVIENYFQKGTKVYLEGKLKHRTYDDKDGIKRYVTEVRVTDFMFLTTKQKLDEVRYLEQADGDTSKSGSDDDDLPF